MSTEFEKAHTLQDRVRIWLGEHHNRYVPTTTEDMASALKIKPYEAYQTLARLKRLGEIEIEKGDKNNIVGIKINKLQPSGRTYERIAERAKKEQPSSEPGTGVEKMAALRAYLEKKRAILDMQQRAREAGLDPENTILFEEDPIAEEGLVLLNMVVDLSTKLKETQEELRMTGYDLEAARRDIDFMKSTKREETRLMLVGAAN